MDELPAGLDRSTGGGALGRPDRAHPLVVGCRSCEASRGFASAFGSPNRGLELLSTGGTVMKISARNVLKGKVVEVKKGQTTAHVRIDIGNGKVLTASITNQAVDDLGLKSGQEAYAVVKASDVMVAVD
jgi:molybdopterin-binding protein